MYNPNHEIFVETKNYTLKTAKSSRELINVFRLRHENFLDDIKDNTETYDLDEFDDICDHLIIKCNETDEVIGTYRIICSLYSDKFYSQAEFGMEDFLATDGVKLELGRACISREHRNGSVIDLLWKGIALYAKLTEARYLFGCSSVYTVRPQMALNVVNYLKDKEKHSTEWDIKPTSKYDMNYDNCTEEAVFDVKGMIPSLLMSYMTAGAKVHGMPALDKDFECCDYMTILDLENISRLFQKRYFKKCLI
jgi:putative hemolysin